MTFFSFLHICLFNQLYSLLWSNTNSLGLDFALFLLFIALGITFPAVLPSIKRVLLQAQTLVMYFQYLCRQLRTCIYAWISGLFDLSSLDPYRFVLSI